MPSYEKSIRVRAGKNDAFDALTTGFENWWTKPDKEIKNVGDWAKFTFPPGKSFWTFEAKALVPGAFVALECVDALHLHEGQPKEIETEWLGTQVIWRLEETQGGTAIHFKHDGLVESLHCFGICEAGWDFFFLRSLKAFLDNGTGMPHIWPDSEARAGISD